MRILVEITMRVIRSQVVSGPVLAAAHKPVPGEHVTVVISGASMSQSQLGCGRGMQAITRDRY
jgi:hypothetical protein